MKKICCDQQCNWKSPASYTKSFDFISANFKQLKVYPEQPNDLLVVGHFDFDEAIPPEDSWIGDLEKSEIEVDMVSDVRSGRKRRYGQVYCHSSGAMKGGYRSELGLRGRLDLLRSTARV